MCICVVAPPGNAYTGKGRYGVVCRNTVWSISERVRGVREDALYKSTLPLPLPLRFLMDIQLINRCYSCIFSEQRRRWFVWMHVCERGSVNDVEDHPWQSVAEDRSWRHYSMRRWLRRVHDRNRSSARRMGKDRTILEDVGWRAEETMGEYVLWLFRVMLITHCRLNRLSASVQTEILNVS